MDLGALILFANELSATVGFYRALGVPLEEERHEDGPVHFACELGATHIAVFEGPAGEPPPFRAGGGVMTGFAVSSLQDALESVKLLGSKVVQAPQEYPWGPRALVEDPDGRTVEIFERKV